MCRILVEMWELRKLCELFFVFRFANHENVVQVYIPTWRVRSPPPYIIGLAISPCVYFDNIVHVFTNMSPSIVVKNTHPVLLPPHTLFLAHKKKTTSIKSQHTHRHIPTQPPPLLPSTQ